MSRSLAVARARERARARESNQAVSWIVAALAFTVAALALVAMFAEYLRGGTPGLMLTAAAAVFLVIGVVAITRGKRGRARH